MRAGHRALTKGSTTRMFDAYHRWLGIPKDQRPPTHYQLLAIPPDEKDPVWSLAMPADGRFVVSGSKDGTARLWEKADAEP